MAEQDHSRNVYRDASAPVEARVEDLLGLMTIEEKAGLMFHTMVSMGEAGALAEDPGPMGGETARQMVLGKGMTHFNLLGVAGAASDMANWHNAMQDLASQTRLGIPVTVSTDPRHSFSENIGASFMAGPFSEWPESLGLAAIGDADLVERFADVARQEYLAVGIRVALHPQIDLATEPRWARQVNTFGEDCELTSRLAQAYVRGFQGQDFGAHSVSTMTKHFPGGGAQKDGTDPHFATGREQVYPGGQFDLHLKPFEAALAAGTRQMMPYYGMPVGTEHEEVGFAFNKSVITGILRERMGFDGIVCTDWGLITDAEIMGQPYPARAWGVEHLSREERMLKLIDAGVDQFGGESCTDVLLGLVEEGRVTEERIDQSVRRLLREKFELGLFDSPLVDATAADAIVGAEPWQAEGAAAQRAAITPLTNGANGVPALPLAPGQKLYVEGIDRDIAANYGDLVDSPHEADVAIVRVGAPFDQANGIFESFFHQGSLEFPASEIERLAAIAEQAPLIVDVYLDRPAVLTPIVEFAAAVLGSFGASGAAVLDVVTGRAESRGRLPFDLPRSMEAVEASHPDVPFDTKDPLFAWGHRVEIGVPVSK